MHGFYWDGKARFGRISPVCRASLGLPRVSLAGIGNGKNSPAVPRLEENHDKEGAHEKAEGEAETLSQGGDVSG